LLGKGKISEIFQKVKNFFQNRGKSETGGKCIMASEGWTPLDIAPCMSAEVRLTIGLDDLAED